MNTKKMTSKLLSFMIAFVMMAGTVGTSVCADGSLQGTGTAEDPFVITTPAELEAFRDLANKNGSLCANLENDIDLSGVNWSPFLPDSNDARDSFSGVFDGKGHKITNLTVNSAESYRGLFGKVYGGTIQNLQVEGTVCSVSGTKESGYNGGNYIGGIVGQMFTGKIVNCSFKGSVESGKSGANIGGIAGHIGNSGASEMTNCANFANVSAINAKGGCAGGIAGYIKNTKIVNCYNSGSVESVTNRAGGIGGNFQNASSAENCYNIGAVSGGDKAKELFSFANNKNKVKNCYSKDISKAFGSAYTNAENCGSIDEDILNNLGSAFTEDSNNINGGYPILKWQAGEKINKEPKIVINGNTELQIKIDGPKDSSILSVSYENTEKSEIEWSIESGEGIVEFMPCVDEVENNSAIQICAVKAGKAVVSAKTGELSDSVTVNVAPYIPESGVEIEDSELAGVGETIRAKIYVTDGSKSSEYDYDNYPQVKYKWKYITKEMYDSAQWTESSFIDLDVKTREFDVPQSLENCYLLVYIQVGNTERSSNRPLRIMGYDELTAAKDKRALTIDTAPVKEEKVIYLPKTCGEKSTVSWQSSNKDIIDPETGKVTLPQKDDATVELKATVEYNGYIKYSTFSITVYSKETLENEKKADLKVIDDALEGVSTLYPEYGTDTNIIEMFKSKVMKNTDKDIEITLEDVNCVYDGADIDSIGNIKYYYKDPSQQSFVHFGSYRVTFKLKYNSAEKDFEVPVTVYWDRDRAESVIKDRVISKIDVGGEYTENISLPKVIDGQMWSQISWKSSDEKAISVSNENQQTAETLFDPYVGVIHRGETDKKVYLSATAVFGFTNDVTGNEKPITVTKMFEVTVKAIDKEKADEIRSELEEKLNRGFKKVPIYDAVTGERLKENDGVYEVVNDIKFPTTRDFGIDGKYYPISIDSSDESVVISPDVNNAARVQVIRPAVGKDPKEADITLTITDSETGIYVSKTFKVNVMPLNTEEIDKEKALMEKVIASYFDGIKGRNEEADNVYLNLEPFTEVYEDKNSNLVWVRTSDKVKGNGIAPTPLKGWEELEAYRLFKSSNPAVIAHETLAVSTQVKAKAVTVTSALSSERFGIYGKLYEENPEVYKDYADLKDLYYRVISTDLKVRGTSTLMYQKPQPEEETISVTFTLRGPDSDLIEKKTYENVDETSSVYDILKKAVSDNGFKLDAKGSYIRGITTNDGEKYSELDYGSNSGWMYKVNGRIPNKTMTGYGLSDGDDILVFYTKDYTKEKGFSHTDISGESSNVKDTGTTENDDKQKDDENTGNDTQKNTFGDVERHWAKEEIAKIAQLGIMKGISDSEFAPDDKLSRAMIVTMFYRLEKEPEAEGTGFTDVSGKDWYFRAVLWAKNNKIVSGVSDSEFAPNDDITREQLAAIIYNYAKFKGYDISVGDNTNILSYQDFDKIEEYAIPAIQFAVGAGIMKGEETGTMLIPGGNATRAEAAVMIIRFIDFCVNKTK